MGLLFVMNGGLSAVRTSNRTFVGIALAGAMVLLIGGCVATPQAGTHPADVGRPTGAASSSASAGTSEVGAGAASGLSITTSVLPSKVMTVTAGVGPGTDQKPSVTAVSQSRALARLVAAAKAKAFRVAAARASSAAVKSASARAAQAHAQQSAAASAAALAAQASSSAAAAAASSESSSAAASLASLAAASKTSATHTSVANADAGLCGAPTNPYRYSYCGSGSVVTSPPADICTYFSCIPYFLKGKGYMEECRDGMVSMSGGRRGACSSHGGELIAVSG